MEDDETFDKLIGVLYETAMEPARWTEALEMVTVLTGAVGAHLFVQDKASGAIVESLFGGESISEQNTGEYISHYMHIDPRVNSDMMQGAVVNEWRACTPYFDRKFVSGNEFFQDFLIPNGVRYSLGAHVDDDGKQLALLGLHRSQKQSPFAKREHQLAQRLGSHIQRALRMYRLTKQLQTQAALSHYALNMLGGMFFVVDGENRVLYTSVEAEQACIFEHSTLSYRFGRLSCREPATASALSAAITRATSEPAVGEFIDMPGSIARQILVNPLKASLATTGYWQRPLALVLIKENHESACAETLDTDRANPDFLPETDSKRDALQRFAASHRLTSRETEVLSGLLKGHSTREIADVNNVGYNTVRTQVASLLQKTGCKRQTDLLRLFLAGQIPR